MSEKLYAQRDAYELDVAGSFYIRHVSAMTSEGLNSKADIAAELGYRDSVIAKLKADYDKLAAECVALKAEAKENKIRGAGEVAYQASQKYMKAPHMSEDRKKYKQIGAFAQSVAANLRAGVKL